MPIKTSSLHANYPVRPNEQRSGNSGPVTPQYGEVIPRPEKWWSDGSDTQSNRGDEFYRQQVPTKEGGVQRGRTSMVQLSLPETWERRGPNRLLAQRHHSNSRGKIVY